MLARPIIAGIAIACLVAAGVVLLTDGDGSGEEEATETVTAIETVDPLPKLPRGWTKTTNAAGGFVVGVPPGWSVKQAGAKTTLRSPGSAVVVRITADRSDEALNANLQEFANGIAFRLDSGAVRKPASAPKPGVASYESARTSVFAGTKQPRPGTSKAASPEKRLDVIVVRRTDLAAYPILVASNIVVKPVELDPIVNRVVGSLRGRPVILGG